MDRQVVVVTGASGGVGRASAVAFAARGAKVALIARGAAGLAGAAAEVREAGGEALVVPTDIADADAVEAAAARIEAELGPIDVWVNAAMATVFAPVLEIEPAEYRRATEVTYLGAVWGTLAALRRMRSRNRGHIIQVGSALAYRSIPLQAPYCGAKHALVGFTDSLRCELIHDASAIRLSMVHLCSFNTPQFRWGRSRMPKTPQPVPPIYQPEAAARAVLKALDEAPRELWVGLPAVQAILGNRIAPWLADRVLARQGYEGQQAAAPADADRPDNLFAPADADTDYGTHGQYDRQASAGDWQFQVLADWQWMGLAGIVALLALSILMLIVGAVF